MEPVTTGWRTQAAAIVDELFPVTPPEAWDGLLDLRRAVLESQDWAGMLDIFLSCRRNWESAHYLPFYRLRRLLAGSLQVECRDPQDRPVEHPALGTILRRSHPSVRDLKRELRRECFEAGLDQRYCEGLRVTFRERKAAGGDSEQNTPPQWAGRTKGKSTGYGG